MISYEFKDRCIIKWSSTTVQTIQCLNDFIRAFGFRLTLFVDGKQDNGHIVRLKYVNNSDSLFIENVIKAYLTENGNDEDDIIQQSTMLRNIIDDIVDELTCETFDGEYNG